MVFDAIDNSRINKNGIKLFALASTGLFLDGYDLSIITMAALVLPAQLHLSELEYILIDISSFAGMLAGAPLLGILSDRIGRKKIFGIDLIFFVLFAITAGLSTNFIELFLSRLLMGFGIGGDYPISSTMMSEFSPKNQGKASNNNGWNVLGWGICFSSRQLLLRNLLRFLEIYIYSGWINGSANNTIKAKCT